jgi:hypothetical protein
MSVFVSFCVVFSGGEDTILKMRCQGFEGLFLFSFLIVDLLVTIKRASGKDAPYRYSYII